MSREIRSIAGMTLGTLFSRLTGFLKWAMMGAALGFTALADAYNLAHILPTMIYEMVLGGIFSAVLVPVVVEQLALPDREAAWKAISMVVNAGVALLLATTAVCWLAAPWLVDLQTLKVGAGRRELVLFFFIIFAPQVLFYGLSAMGNGLLNARGRFAMAAFAPVFNNLAVIASLALYMAWPGFGKLGLALGTTFGVLLQFLVLAPSLRASGFRYFSAVDFRHPAVVKMAKLSGPVLLYVVFNQVNLTVQNNLAIPLTGGVSALQYAFTFYILPHGLFAVSIGTVLLPGLSELSVRKDWQGFARTMERGMAWSAAAIIPAMAVYVSMSLPIVEVLMQRGRFTAADSRLLATVLSCYSLGLFAFTLYLFINRVFYSLQDTWTPLALNFTGNLVNSVFNLLAVGALGVPGLALGHAVAYTVIAVSGLALIARRIRELRLGPLLASISKAAAASSVIAVLGAAGTFAWRGWMAGFSLWPKAAMLTGYLAFLFGAYLALARIFKLAEVSSVLAMLRQRLLSGRNDRADVAKP